MPTRREVRKRLIQLINEIAKIPIEQLTDTATVDDELQMESVAFVELLVAIEEDFQIELDPLQVVELNEFAAIVNYVYESVVRVAADPRAEAPYEPGMEG